MTLPPAPDCADCLIGFVRRDSRLSEQIAVQWLLGQGDHIANAHGKGQCITICPCCGRAPAAAEPVAREDRLLALMLAVIRAMRAGRTLPQVPVGELTSDEPIGFRADGLPRRPAVPTGRAVLPRRGRYGGRPRQLVRVLRGSTRGMPCNEHAKAKERNLKITVQ